MENQKLASGKRRLDSPQQQPTVFKKLKGQEQAAKSPQSPQSPSSDVRSPLSSEQQLANGLNREANSRYTNGNIERSALMDGSILNQSSSKDAPTVDPRRRPTLNTNLSATAASTLPTPLQVEKHGGLHGDVSVGSGRSTPATIANMTGTAPDSGSSLQILQDALRSTNESNWNVAAKVTRISEAEAHVKILELGLKKNKSQLSKHAALKESRHHAFEGRQNRKERVQKHLDEIKEQHSTTELRQAQAILSLGGSSSLSKVGHINNEDLQQELSKITQERDDMKNGLEAANAKHEAEIQKLWEFVKQVDQSEAMRTAKADISKLQSDVESCRKDCVALSMLTPRKDAAEDHLRRIETLESSSRKREDESYNDGNDIRELKDTYKTLKRQVSDVDQELQNINSWLKSAQSDKKLKELKSKFLGLEKKCSKEIESFGSIHLEYQNKTEKRFLGQIETFKTEVKDSLSELQESKVEIVTLREDYHTLNTRLSDLMKTQSQSRIASEVTNKIGEGEAAGAIGSQRQNQSAPTGLQDEYKDDLKEIKLELYIIQAAIEAIPDLARKETVEVRDEVNSRCDEFDSKIKALKEMIDSVEGTLLFLKTKATSEDPVNKREIEEVKENVRDLNQKCHTYITWETLPTDPRFKGFEDKLVGLDQEVRQLKVEGSGVEATTEIRGMREALDATATALSSLESRCNNMTTDEQYQRVAGFISTQAPLPHWKEKAAAMDKIGDDLRKQIEDIRRSFNIQVEKLRSEIGAAAPTPQPIEASTIEPLINRLKDVQEMQLAKQYEVLDQRISVVESVICRVHELLLPEQRLKPVGNVPWLHGNSQTVEMDTT